MQNKGRSYRKKAHSSEDEEEGCNPENSEAKEQIRDSQDASETLEELIELRKYRRRPQGIDVEKLSKGDIKLRKKKKEEDPWKLNSGGLVDIEAVKATKDEEDDESSERKIMLDSFTKQTNALDVDKHMMAFIEEEMRKRRGQTAVSQNDEEDTDIKPPNPEDELFQPPDHLRIESKPISEGNVQLSTTMLTAIPEVDLGIDVRLKNIEDTEKAKRQLLEQRHQKPVEDKTSVPAFPQQIDFIVVGLLPVIRTVDKPIIQISLRSINNINININNQITITITTTIRVVNEEKWPQMILWLNDSKNGLGAKYEIKLVV